MAVFAKAAPMRKSLRAWPGSKHLIPASEHARSQLEKRRPFEAQDKQDRRTPSKAFLFSFRLLTFDC